MKQAVVLIHGIGEQKPMDTLRGFVSAVLGPGEHGKDAFWSKPDPMSELFELRRLQSMGRTSTHFYEYYWAYNVEGTKIIDVLYWLWQLVIRPGKDVPRSAKSLWLACRLMTAIAVLIAALGVLTPAYDWFTAQPKWGLGWITVMLALFVVQYFLVSYLGDAARYLSPRPRNIKLRQRVRAQGVRLLRTLHERGDYDRIIVVGHSLGSVIAYDLISRLWQDYNERLPALDKDKVRKAVRECLAAGIAPQANLRKGIGKSGDALKKGGDQLALDAFHKAQRDTWHELRAFGNPWRITDFITIGSPLAHGMLLLANSRDDFQNRKRQRELPTCPPQRDGKGYAYADSAPIDIGEGKKFTPLIPHHAAFFAVTRWTNLYFPAWLGLFGDFVGGPLRSEFGLGISDIPVKTSAWNGWLDRTIFAHNRYWSLQDTIAEEGSTSAGSGARPVLIALKDALDLSYLRKFDTRDWWQDKANDVRNAGAAAGHLP